MKFELEIHNHWLGTRKDDWDITLLGLTRYGYKWQKSYSVSVLNFEFEVRW